MRISQVARAIARSMPVDMVTPQLAATITPPPGIRQRLVLPARRERSEPLAWVSWCTGKQPFLVCRVSSRQQIRALRSIDLSGYSLIWCHRAENLHLLPSRLASSLVVDLDDLESSKRRLHAMSLGSATTAIRGHARNWFIQADSRRHERLRNLAASRSAATVLANPDDLVTAGLSNAYRVRNGYPVPSSPDFRARLSRTPRVLLFVGLMTYAPNTAAAHTLARLAPVLAEDSPDLDIRIVGQHRGRLADIADMPHVTVVGEVKDLGPELEQADVVMTPIPYGGGTRIKIIEAMAHGIPVVSSTIGAAGLGLAPERHFLTAEDEQQLVQAWLRLRGDWGPTVGRMMEEAYNHVKKEFSFDAVCRDVDAVLGAVR
jgi:glycosyltransferase involved in cell wall biosynthesis